MTLTFLLTFVVAAIALWALVSAMAKRPPAQRGDRHVVAYPIGMKVIGLLFPLLLLVSWYYVLVHGPRPIFGFICVTAIFTPLLILCRAILRIRFEYNDTGIVYYSTFGQPRHFSFSDLRSVGAIGPYGYPIETRGGDEIKVATQLQGHLQLHAVLKAHITRS